jgi:hypothetical protein
LRTGKVASGFVTHLRRLSGSSRGVNSFDGQLLANAKDAGTKPPPSEATLKTSQSCHPLSSTAKQEIPPTSSLPRLQPVTASKTSAQLKRGDDQAIGKPNSSSNSGGGTKPIAIALPGLDLKGLRSCPCPPTGNNAKVAIPSLSLASLPTTSSNQRQVLTARRNTSRAQGENVPPIQIGSLNTQRFGGLDGLDVGAQQQTSRANRETARRMSMNQRTARRGSTMQVQPLPQQQQRKQRQTNRRGSIRPQGSVGTNCR